MKRLIVASTNAGKVREIQSALSDLPDWQIEPLPAGVPSIDETGSGFIENATLKAAHYSRFVDGLTLGDDSGLCVHALNNAPGILSARYGPSAEARNARVLAELDALKDPNRSATFVCACAVARAGTILWTTETHLEGYIASAPVGEGGFGYDPIFFVPELGKTLAQLALEEKNRTSARGRALVELRLFLTA